MSYVDIEGLARRLDRVGGGLGVGRRREGVLQEGGRRGEGVLQEGGCHGSQDEGMLQARVNKTSPSGLVQCSVSS